MRVSVVVRAQLRHLGSPETRFSMRSALLAGEYRQLRDVSTGLKEGAWGSALSEFITENCRLSRSGGLALLCLQWFCRPTKLVTHKKRKRVD